MTTHTATATETTTEVATTRTVVSRRPGTYIISHRRQDDTGKVLYRTDGPAQIRGYPNDDDQHLITVWYDHSRQHRLDGPAYTSSDGDMYWRTTGTRHITSVNSREGSDQ